LFCAACHDEGSLDDAGDISITSFWKFVWAKKKKKKKKKKQIVIWRGCRKEEREEI
jgi:hypothetical protein